ncbi:MAG: dephospho-CoA kinase [Proteobacteria bacterium]|nr:dephospho-CoA kinase [Pseudomonadota bacterium]
MIIGLTGAVASGKSLVADEFEKLGARVIDADVIARELLCPGKEAFDKVVSEFGDSILTKSGEIERTQLAEIVFNDCEMLVKLNRITHPEIIHTILERIKEIREESPDALIVLDAPLLIEVGLHEQVDRVVVVYVDEETLIERIVERDKLDPKEAVKRLACQMPLKEKIEYADHVIYNKSTIEETLKQVDDIFADLSEERT